MRNFIRFTTISAMLAAMLISAYNADAQATRRANTTSSSRSTTTSTQSTDERGRNTATATRSNSGTSSSTSGTQTNRVTATSRSNNSSASRSNASTSTQSTQDRRSSTSTANRSASTSSSTSAARVTGTSRSSGTSASSTGTAAATQSTQDRRTTTGTTSATRSAGTSASSRTGSTGTTAERVTATASRGVTASAVESTSSQQTGGTVTRSNIRATSRAGLTSSSEMQERRTTTASRSAGGITATGNKASSQTLRELNYSGRGYSSLRLDDRGNLNRIPPRERDYTRYDRPGHFYGSEPHYFGYRIHTLPPSYRRIRHWGVDYYYYNNVYYRHYGSYYVVCRPPFGVVIDFDFVQVPFARVRFAYYHDVFHRYDVIDSNYRTIINQNRIIAQNNARIARQNRSLALNSSMALSSYEIATALGLIQSYADISSDYFYEDGVFYAFNRNGRYEVIVPPAGALVDELPDDYDVIVLNGVEYYKVDDTVYRLVLIGGTPCLEVLGQMYGTMARQYNYYYQ